MKYNIIKKIYTLLKSPLWVAGSLLFLFPTMLCAQDLDAISRSKGITASGGLNFANTFYSGNSDIIHRDPYLFFLTGNINLNLYGFDLPFSFALSNTNKSYTQPFNRFEFAPKYKWAKLRVGSTAMDFSKYTLAGHRFTGVGVELTPGNWNVSAMYGRLLNSIEYDPLAGNLSSVSYRRMGYGVKAGYADKGDEVNVIFFSAKDDLQSLKYYVPDSADLHPQENTTVSVYGKKSFLKHFFVQAEYAFSLYNSELRNEAGEQLHTSNIIDKICGKKGNDRYVDAFNASAGYQNPLWGMLLGYERVAPDYQTLGGYYFTNDVEIFKLAPNVNLWKGKLRISGSLGFEFNNLDEQKANDTRRTVGAANLAFAPNEAWNVSAGYSNFTTFTQFKPTAYPFYVDNLDSLNFYQVTQTFNATASYMFGNKEKLMNTVMATASYQTGGTRSGDVQGDYSDFLTLMLSFGEQWIPQNLSWAVFATANYVDAAAMSSLYWGPGISLSKGFLKNALTTGITCNYNHNTVDGVKVASLLNTSLSAQYSLQDVDKKFGKHSFSLNSGLTNYLKTATEQQRKYEFLTTLTYNIKF